MPSSRASMAGCGTNCSTRRCSRHWPRPASRSDVGGPITTTHDHTRSLDGKRRPSSPSPAVRAGIWRCAMPRVPRQLPSPSPPNRANPTARANSGLDKTWGQGHAFLDSVGFKVADAYSNLCEFKSNYLESGWFRDGPTGEVDYYNTWSIPYDLFWISEMNPSIDRAFIDDAISKSSYLTRHLLSPAGLAMMGRSICYRTSVPSPVSINALRKKSVEHEREARRALDVTWNYFISNKILRDGTITMGYTDNDPRLVDNYSGPGSCHWGLRSLTLAYMNRPTASFWTNGSSPLPVEISDYHIDLDAIGWKVDGVKSSGEIRSR